MAEKFHEKSDLDLDQYKVTEQRYTPRTLDFRQTLTDKYKASATEDVRQIYLSHPSDEYSLWLSEEKRIGGPTTYRTSLKNRGEWTSGGGLKRVEFPAEIDAELFQLYDHDVPAIHKVRARPREGVIIDFYDNGYVHAESFDPQAWRHFIDENGFHDEFQDVTNGDNKKAAYNQGAYNEWRAHRNYRLDHGGREALTPNPPLNLDIVVEDILSIRDGKPIIVQIGGRSGSGKTTVIGSLHEKLQTANVTSLTLSTDDYNFGRTHLYALANSRGQEKWVNYDSDEVYDLELFKSHMEKIKSGEVIPKYHFDHEPEERLTLGNVKPAEVIVFEGIKANHPSLRGVAHLAYEIPTSFATSLGRRSMRDLIERPRFAMPRHNLVYCLRYVEPAYQAMAA